MHIIAPSQPPCISRGVKSTEDKQQSSYIGKSKDRPTTRKFFKFTFTWNFPICLAFGQNLNGSVSRRNLQKKPKQNKTHKENTSTFHIDHCNTQHLLNKLDWRRKGITLCDGEKTERLIDILSTVALKVKKIKIISNMKTKPHTFKQRNKQEKAVFSFPFHLPWSPPPPPLRRPQLACHSVFNRTC